MASVVNYVISPFDGNIHTGDPQGIKLYLQVKKDMETESNQLDISVSNSKDVVENFLSLAKKYGWRCLAFMLHTGACDKKKIWQIDKSKN